MSARATMELICDGGKVWRDADTDKMFMLVDIDSTGLLITQGAAAGAMDVLGWDVSPNADATMYGLINLVGSLRSQCDDTMSIELTRLRAENERLRGSLRKISTTSNSGATRAYAGGTLSLCPALGADQ